MEFLSQVICLSTRSNSTGFFLLRSCAQYIPTSPAVEVGGNFVTGLCPSGDSTKHRELYNCRAGARKVATGSLLEFVHATIATLWWQVAFFFASDFRVNRVNYIAIADCFSSIALFDLGGKISWPKSALLVDCRWFCMAVSGCRPSHYPFVKLLATKYDPTPKSLNLGKPRVLVSTLVCQLKPVDSSWGKWMFCGAVPFWSVAQTLVSGKWSSRCCWGWGDASWPWTSIWDAQGMVRLVEALSTFMGYSMV